MVDHGARDHATWSASSTERNVACPGALALSAGMPDKESKAAAWGTACHQISERCLKDGVPAVNLIGEIEKTKEHEFEVDEEMAETAQMYIDYVREAYTDGPLGNALHIEKKFSLMSLSPPFEAGGTADAIVYNREQKLLEVIDLKGGRGHVVEARDNPQLRTYALGSLLAFPGLAVEQVKVTIVQPRAFHKDGRIRSEQFHIVELMDWTTDLLEAMGRSHLALAELENSAPMDLWEADHLNPGDHCTFCKAAPTCPALQAKSLAAAHTFFKDESVAKPPEPSTLDPSQIANILDAADMIEGWLNAVRAYGHTLAESGVEIPGYQLAAKIGRRAWVDEAEAARFAAAFGPAIYAPAKLKSPAQMEKLFGKNVPKGFAELCPAKSSGTNLVASSKTTRPAVAPRVTQFFSPIV